MLRNAFGMTGAVGLKESIETERMRLTISPRRSSLVTPSLRLSSAVTPLLLRARTTRLPSASASSHVSSLTPVMFSKEVSPPT